MFDKAKISELRAKLEATLKEFGEANGLDIGVGNIRFDATSFKAELAVTDKNANPNSVDPKFLMDLKRRGIMHGLSESMIGKVVSVPNRGNLDKFEFVGMKNSKAVMKNLRDGKNYLFNADDAARYLKAA